MITQSEWVAMHWENERLRKEVERLKSENERLKKIEIFYKELCKEWDEDCKDDCNSYGHNEECGNVSLAAAKRALKSENKKLKDELDHLRIKIVEVSFDHPCYTLSKELEAENSKLKEALENVFIPVLSLLKDASNDETAREHCRDALKQYKEMMKSDGGE